MYSLHPYISTLIYNVDQYRVFVEPGYNISDVQSTYPRVWLNPPSHFIQRFLRFFFNLLKFKFNYSFFSALSFK